MTPVEALAEECAQLANDLAAADRENASLVSENRALLQVIEEGAQEHARVVEGLVARIEELEAEKLSLRDALNDREDARAAAAARVA